MPPCTVSHTRVLPAIMWVQPVVRLQSLAGSAGLPLKISYGKTKARVSVTHPPVTDCRGPNGPSTDTSIEPLWLSWYQRCPNTGSMRAYMPSPPLRTCHSCGPRLLGLLHTVSI